MSDYDKEIEKAKKAINSWGLAKGTARAYSYLVGEKVTASPAGPVKTYEYNQVLSGACHAMMREVGNPIICAGGLVPSKEQSEDCELFWKWVTSKKSPWYCLTKGIETVRDKDNLIIGWLLTDRKILSSVPFSLLKNLCILTRSFTERNNTWKTWCLLVKKGMSEGDAWYFSSVFSLCDYANAREGLINLELRSGAHWALTDIQQENVDFKILRGEKPVNLKAKSNSVRVNLHFLAQPLIQAPVYNVKDLKYAPTQGRFSTAHYYLLQDAVDDFYKWQDQEEKLRV